MKKNYRSFVAMIVLVISFSSACSLMAHQVQEWQHGVFVNKTDYDLMVNVRPSHVMGRGCQDISFDVKGNAKFEFDLLPGYYIFTVTRAGQTIQYNWKVDSQHGDNSYDGKVYDFLVVQFPGR